MKCRSYEKKSGHYLKKNQAAAWKIKFEQNAKIQKSHFKNIDFRQENGSISVIFAPNNLKPSANER